MLRSSLLALAAASRTGAVAAVEIEGQDPPGWPWQYCSSRDSLGCLGTEVVWSLAQRRQVRTDAAPLSKAAEHGFPGSAAETAAAAELATAMTSLEAPAATVEVSRGLHPPEALIEVVALSAAAGEASAVANLVGEGELLREPLHRAQRLLLLLQARIEGVDVLMPLLILVMGGVVLFGFASLVWPMFSSSSSSSRAAARAAALPATPARAALGESTTTPSKSHQRRHPRQPSQMAAAATPTPRPSALLTSPSQVSFQLAPGEVDVLFTEAAETPPTAQGGARHSIGEALSNIISPARPLEPLCPMLVIPEGQECVLHVPTDGGRGTQLLVKNNNGLAVFCVAISQKQEGGRAIVLRAAQDDFEFAHCTASTSPLGLTVYHADARQFGDITVESPGTSYILKDMQGGSLRCQCDSSGKLTLKSSSGAKRLFGVAEPGSVRAVKVGPGVDAGLVVLAVVSWDVLERERSQTS